MPLTEIILTENIPGLGAEADVVKVRRGYSRNYLLPRGKAHEVTPASLRQLDTLKAKRAGREARELNAAEELARRIGKARILFTLETGESGNGPGRGWLEKNGGLRGGQSLTSSSQDIHRTPPHSVEAEQGVLGSMLISPREAIGECVEKINEEYFYVPAHQTIYNVLVDLWNAGQAIDLITFTQVLRDRNLLETVGGAALVTSLFTFVPTA